jgi:hypothetical protein
MNPGTKPFMSEACARLQDSIADERQNGGASKPFKPRPW